MVEQDRRDGAADVTVVIPAHNPDLGRLARVGVALAAQTLPHHRWELILVDNASSPPLGASTLGPQAAAHAKVVAEPELGLTAARRCGFAAAQAPLIVLVDDDNVLAPGYLEDVIRLFALHPKLGAAGGPVRAEFERNPEAWQEEFLPLLALRDLGPTPLIARASRPAGATQNSYPACSPVGAGMALRREAAASWFARTAADARSDRRGSELSSAGDNEIVLNVLEQGWDVGYFPELAVTHLIPASRLERGYLGRLNHGVQRSWMQVLSAYAANPWPPVPHWTVPIRRAKAWWTYRAWSSPANYVRWCGACGHFEGRVRQR